MKALTLHPEHAEGFVCGLRTIETRGWATRYRGPLILHAGKRDPDSPAARREPQSRAILDAIPHGRGLVRGAVVATCTLVDVVPMEELIWSADWRSEVPGPFQHWVHMRHDVRDRVVVDKAQRPYGDFGPGRWAWLLDDIKPTTERCPACWGSGEDWELVRSCPTCDGAGRCDPVPARGKQGLWEWTP